MRRRLLSEGGLKASLISQLDTQTGDVVFANPGYEEIYFYRLGNGNDIIPEGYVPIGIVVVPSSDNRYGQYQCGVMSLCDMSCSNPFVGGGNEARRNQMCWGEEVSINEFVTSEDDYNGKEKTDAIIAYRGVRSSDWKPESNTSSDYPAASCCNLFYTPGTNQGDWYLPASGEGKYVMENLNLLESVIAKCNSIYGIGANFDYEYWCSTEYSSTDAYVMNKVLFYYTMQKTYPLLSVRAFIRIQTLERNYGDIFISGGTVSDIPAGGGESQVSGYTYSQTYGYGDSTTNGGTITSGADIEVTSVSADTLGTTEKERTKIGDSVLTVTMNGKSATESYEVYQQANVRSVSGTSGGAYSYGNISAGSITNATIGAGGGSATARAGNGSQSWSRTAITTNYSYTSGATSSAVTTAAQSGINSVAPSASSYTASANSKGTSVSGVTTVGSKYITWSANGKSTGGTMYVYQAANSITSYGYYNGRTGINVFTTVDTSKYFDIIAKPSLQSTGDATSGFDGIYYGGTSGGTGHVFGARQTDTGEVTIKCKMMATATYSSGSTANVEVSPSSVSVNSASQNDPSSLNVSISGSWPTFTLKFSSFSSSSSSAVLTGGICCLSVKNPVGKVRGYCIGIYRPR